ncbi:MAG: Flp family type IVb pilin [Acidobacteria bacterium]|jgi:Flp pilus assembly pilin Flp|nr:Flp family type IVb pilin [Acidobacteriota bacterium]
MQQLMTWVNSILNARGNEEQGTSAVEYAILIILIAALVVTAGSTLGNAVSNAISTMATKIVFP